MRCFSFLLSQRTMTYIYHWLVSPLYSFRIWTVISCCFWCHYRSLHYTAFNTLPPKYKRPAPYPMEETSTWIDSSSFPLKKHFESSFLYFMEQPQVPAYHVRMGVNACLLSLLWWTLSLQAPAGVSSQNEYPVL